MKRIVGLILGSLILVQCSDTDDSLITKNQVGIINNKTGIEEIDILFKNDSIAKFPEGAGPYAEYKIYGENEKHILTIKPSFKNDTIELIESVQVFSDYYLTEKGISSSSTFADVVEQYSINKIEPTFSSALLFIDEINMTIALDKKDLKIDEFDMRKISQDQIPDNAKINYLTVWFD